MHDVQPDVLHKCSEPVRFFAPHSEVQQRVLEQLLTPT